MPAWHRELGLPASSPEFASTLEAAADVHTESTTFWVMQSTRLDLGYG